MSGKTEILLHMYRELIGEAQNLLRLSTTFWTVYAAALAFITALGVGFFQIESGTIDANIILMIRIMIATIGSLVVISLTIQICAIDEMAYVCRDRAQEIVSIINEINIEHKDENELNIDLCHFDVVAAVRSVESKRFRSLLFPRTIVLTYMCFIFLAIWWFIWVYVAAIIWG